MASESFAHGRQVTNQVRLGQDDGHINVKQPGATLSDKLLYLGQEQGRLGIFPAFVTGRKPGAHVAERQSTEYGVTHRVGHRVTVRVPLAAAVCLEPQGAQHQRPAIRQAMYVVSLPYPHWSAIRLHGSILRLAGSTPLFFVSGRNFQLPRQRAQPADGNHSPYDNPILVALPDAVVIFDGKLRCCWANPAAETLLGSSLARLKGRGCTEVFGNGHWIGALVERCNSATGQVSARGSGSLDDHSIADQLAKSVDASVASLPAPDEATVLVLHEAAANAALEITTREKTRMAEMDHIVASIGHELNNPLSGIRGAAQLVKDQSGNDKRVEGYCDIILRQVDRMGELSQILMELEAPVPKPRATNIHRVLNQVVELQEVALSGQQLTIERLFDPSLPDVLGDAEYLQVLFLNLVSNAVSACQPEAGHVTVKTAIDNSFHVANDNGKLRYVKVDVIDDGCGLDESTLQNMFNPFYSGRKDGHGLGLAITRNIVAAHGGTIRADNRQAGGACFTVHLPVAGNSTDE